MIREGYTFSTGTNEDKEEVLRLSRAMDLDIQEFSIDDFCVVKKARSIVGFGRLRPYKGFDEVATLGVVNEERNKGLGSAVVKQLLKRKRKEVYLTCVIPGFFSRLGFTSVAEYPGELTAKYDFCRSFGYSKDEVYVMKFDH